MTLSRYSKIRLIISNYQEMTLYPRMIKIIQYFEIHAGKFNLNWGFLNFDSLSRLIILSKYPLPNELSQIGLVIWVYFTHSLHSPNHGF